MEAPSELNTTGKHGQTGDRIQKQDVEKAEVITSLTATDCHFRRHNSLSGTAAGFPIAPSPGTAAQTVKVYYCAQNFKAFPARGDAHSGHSVLGREWEKGCCLLTFTSIAASMNTGTQFIPIQLLNSSS